MKYKVILLPLFLLFVLGSCVTPKDTNFLQDIDKNYPTDDITPIDYKIIPGDQLTLMVYTLDENMKALFSMYIVNSLTSPTATPLMNISIAGQQNISSGGSGMGGVVANNSGDHIPNNVLNVSSTGTVNIPYIGEVNVLDMTILEAKKVIGDRFKEYSSLVNIDVALRNRYFFVLGEMGARPVRMANLRMTIFQALAQSNEITPFANRKQIRIIRQTSAGTEVKTFDLRSKDIVNSDFYYIQPNDVIYAPQMQRKFFGGSTSFLGLLGIITSFVGTVLLIIGLVK